MTLESKFPKLIALCIYENQSNLDKAITCFVEPRKDQTLSQIVDSKLVHHKVTLKIHQLLCNGEQSPPLYDQVLISELLDLNGLITTLIVYCQPLVEIDQQKPTVNENIKNTEQQQTFQSVISSKQNITSEKAPSNKVCLLEQSWKQSYFLEKIYSIQSDSKQLIQYQEIIQSKLSFQVQVLASFKIVLLHNCDIVCLIEHANFLQQNHLWDVPFQKCDAQLLLIRDTYGGQCIALMKPQSSELMLCLPMLSLFQVQLLAANGFQKIAACQPSKDVKVVAGCEQGQTNINIVCVSSIQSCSDEIKQNQLITMLLNIDGFCFSAECEAGVAVAIQTALQQAYSEQFGDQYLSKQDIEFLQLIQKRNASIRLSDFINDKFIDKFQAMLNGLQQKYLNLELTISQMLIAFDSIQSYKRDTILAVFRYIAFRNDVIRIQLLTLISIAFNNPNILQDKKDIYLDLLEQIFIFPYESQISEQFNIDIFNCVQLTSRADSLRKCLAAFSQYRYIQQVIPFSKQQDIFPVIEKEAPQFGYLNCCILIIDKDNHTVQTGQKSYIIPNSQLPLSSAVFSQQFKKIIQVLPKIQSKRMKPGIFKDVILSLEIIAKDNNVVIDFISDCIVNLNHDQNQLNKRSTVCIFGIAYAQHLVTKTPLSVFMKEFSVTYTGKLDQMNQFHQVLKSRMQRQQQDSKLLDGTHYYLFIPTEGQVVIDNQTGLPPHYYGANTTDSVQAALTYFKQSFQYVTIQIGLKMQYKNIKLISLTCDYSETQVIIEDSKQFSLEQIENVCLSFLSYYEQQKYNEILELTINKIITEEDDFYIDEDNWSELKSKNEPKLQSLRRFQKHIPGVFSNRYQIGLLLFNNPMMYMFNHIICCEFLKIETDSTMVIEQQITQEVKSELWQDWSIIFYYDLQFLRKEMDTIQVLNKYQSQYSNVDEKQVGQSITTFFSRLPASCAEKFAINSNILFDVIQQQQIGSCEVAMNEASMKLLDVLCNFNENYELDGQYVQREQQALNKYMAMQKYMLKYVIQLEIPQNAKQQQQFELTLRCKHAIIQRVEVVKSRHEKYFKQAVNIAICRYQLLSVMLDSLNNSMKASQSITFEIPVTQNTEQQNNLLKTDDSSKKLDINEQVNSFLRMCEEEQ